jgi:hypothetical protein
VALLLEVDQRDHLVHWAGPGIGRGVELHRLLDREHRLDGRLLRDDPYALAERPGRALGVEAEHPHVAGVALAVPLEDLEDGRLACSVRAEEGDDLAGRHGQVHAAHRLHLFVALSQATNVDHGGKQHPHQECRSA